jgi:hypothetical protein
VPLAILDGDRLDVSYAWRRGHRRPTVQE